MIDVRPPEWRPGNEPGSCSLVLVPPSPWATVLHDAARSSALVHAESIARRLRDQGQSCRVIDVEREVPTLAETLDLVERTCPRGAIVGITDRPSRRCAEALRRSLQERDRTATIVSVSGPGRSLADHIARSVESGRLGDLTRRLRRRAPHLVYDWLEAVNLCRLGARSREDAYLERTLVHRYDEMVANVRGEDRP